MYCTIVGSPTKIFILFKDFYFLNEYGEGPAFLIVITDVHVP